MKDKEKSKFRENKITTYWVIQIFLIIWKANWPDTKNNICWWRSSESWFNSFKIETTVRFCPYYPSFTFDRNRNTCGLNVMAKNSQSAALKGNHWIQWPRKFYLHNTNTTLQQTHIIHYILPHHVEVIAQNAQWYSGSLMDQRRKWEQGSRTTYKEIFAKRKPRARKVVSCWPTHVLKLVTMRLLLFACI